MSATENPHRHNEEYYRLLFVANPLPMWVFEIASGRFLAVNREACRRYGYSEAEFLAMTIADIRSPSDAAQLDAIRSLRPAGHRDLGAWRHRRKNGEVIDVEIMSDDIAFSGRDARLVLAKDVTELMRTTSALRESEERFEYVARATNDAIWDFRPADGTLWWNSGLERLSGYTPDEVATIGQWRPMIHPEDRERVRRGVDAALAGESDQWSCDYRVRRRDGSVAFVYDRGFVIRNESGAAARMVGAVTDLSERKASEDRLREQAMLLDKARDAIIVRDLAHRVRYWNAAAERLYGIPADQAIGRDIEDLLVSRDPELFRQADAQVLATGEWAGSARQLLRDGRTVTIDGHWTLLRDERGRATGVLKINTDITERVDLEQRLAQSQKLEAIGQLTGGIAHDFNNLLTVIIGNSELLAEELAGQPRMAALATMIRTAGERGAELTNRLLAFARRQALEPANVHLHELIDGMRGLLQRSLSESVDLHVVHGQALPLVSIDPGQFEAALLNLCINARDAMAQGGRLTIETSSVTLDQAYADQHPDAVAGPYVLVAVSDTGTGMPADIVARAFDPFFTTKAKGEGTGLGLSMVYGFTKQSGGHAAIYSEPGVGTVVKLYLPRIEATPDAIGPAAMPQIDAGGSEMVLLVEDDDLVRDHAARLLADLGYRVLIASDGPAALALLRENPVDLLFTDVIMPGGMNGPRLAEAAHAMRPDLPVLYASGYTENAIVHHNRVDPGINLLHKPYRRQALAQKIRATLDGAHGEPAAGAGHG